MTVGELIDILQGYAIEYGEDAYVVLANDREIFGDAWQVGVDDLHGDIIVSTQW